MDAAVSDPAAPAISPQGQLGQFPTIHAQKKTVEHLCKSTHVPVKSHKITETLFCSALQTICVTPTRHATKNPPVNCASSACPVVMWRTTDCSLDLSNGLPTSPEKPTRLYSATRSTLDVMA